MTARRKSWPHRVTGATEDAYVTALLRVLALAHRVLDERGVPRPARPIEAHP